MLLFIPWRTGLFRFLAVALFAGFHVGMALCMDLTLFSAVSITAWLAFLPGGFWDWLARRRGPSPSPALQTAAAVTVRLPWPVNLLVGIMLLYALLWNIRSIDADRWGAVLPKELNRFGTVLGLDQAWNMFAPFPWTEDGWHVAPAILEDGRRVDVMNHGAAFTWDKPESVSDRFKNERWRKYFEKHIMKPDAELRKRYVVYLMREWNSTHSADEQIVELKWYYMLERTLPDYEPPSVRRIFLARAGLKDPSSPEPPELPDQPGPPDPDRD